MAYSKEELLNLGAKDISEARIKIVGLNLFDYVDDFDLLSRTENSIDYTLELYRDYLEELKKFSKTNLEKILKALRNLEVIDNHSLERENPSLLQTYNETHHSTAITYLVKRLISDGAPLNDSIIIKAHEILMRGTSNQEQVSIGFRNNNNYFVGYSENNENVALFYPISYDEIPKAIKLFCSYFNSKTTSERDIMVKAIISHGILSALQVFEDGNTRLSRTLENVDLFKRTSFIDDAFSLPTIYCSKAYLPYRPQYRELISQLALEPNSENWNSWLNFNLYRLQDQIYLNTNNLSRIRKM